MRNYMDHIREITSRVSMGFYNNSSEDIGEICINRKDWSLDESAIKVSAPSADWMYPKRTQLITYGMTTRKYATLDGYSKLDGSCYIADTTPRGVMGLWGDVCSSEIDGTFPAGQEPIVTVYFNMSRELTQVIVTGNQAWRQFPVDYDIVLYPRAMMMQRSQSAAPLVGVDKEGHEIIGEIGMSGNEATLTYKIRGGLGIEQIITFLDASGVKAVSFQKMKLVIKKWSHPGAVAKIMYFSRDKNMVLNADDIRSITLYEEKAQSVDKLSFGLSSNSLTVEAKDAEGRFSKNPDLLKKNRLIMPSVALKEEGAEPLDEYFFRIGKFYSDSWEMDSKSSFVKCKAYDILYSLQELTIRFPIRLRDGKYTIEQNMSVYDAITRIVEVANDTKKESEIYGVDIVCEIDEALRNVMIPFAMFEEKSAWDLLQDISNYALCNVFTNRQGKMIVSCDIPPENTVITPQTPLAGVEINSGNAFTYSLPIQSRTIINRVVMPYRRMMQGKAEDDEIEIKSEEIKAVEYEEDGVTKTKYVFEAKLKNFYPEINKIELERRSEEAKIDLLPQVKEFQIFCNKIVVALNSFDANWKIFLIVNRVDVSSESTGYIFEDAELVLEAADKHSIKANGLCEFKAEKSSYMTSEALARQTATRILNKYNDGVTYTETDWIGSPELQLGNVIQCSNKYEKDADGNEVKHTFECLSNEFKIDGGLRVKSKLRESPQ